GGDLHRIGFHIPLLHRRGVGFAAWTWRRRTLRGFPSASPPLPATIRIHQPSRPVAGRAAAAPLLALALPGDHGWACTSALWAACQRWRAASLHSTSEVAPHS